VKPSHRQAPTYQTLLAANPSRHIRTTSFTRHPHNHLSLNLELQALNPWAVDGSWHSYDSGVSLTIGRYQSNMPVEVPSNFTSFEDLFTVSNSPPATFQFYHIRYKYYFFCVVFRWIQRRSIPPSRGVVFLIGQFARRCCVRGVWLSEPALYFTWWSIINGNASICLPTHFLSS
jgi:hypothetical protein